VNSSERRNAGHTALTPESEPAATPAAFHAAGVRELAAGRPLGAQLACEQALKLDPNHADSLHLMGVLSFRAQQYDHAVEWLVRAIRREPRPEFLASLGRTLRRLGRHDEALQTFDKAIQLKPTDAELWRELGETLTGLKRTDEAVLALQHALALDPDNFGTAHQCGDLLRTLRRFEEALACFVRCDELRPNHAQTLYLRGHTLLDLRRPGGALADLKRARALDPNHPGIRNSLGCVLKTLGRHDEALAAFDKAIALKPDYVEALNSNAALLAQLGRVGEALTLSERVLRLQPDHVPIHINRALWLSELHRFDEAFASFEQALALDPGNADATWNLSFVQLLTGNFEAGWAGREARWKAQARSETSYPDFAEPRWHGEPIAGKRLLIYAEEGLGDAIQFARYIPLVTAQGAEIIVVVGAPLYPLLSALPGIAQCLTKPLAEHPTFDVHCALSSLPLIFGTRLETIPPANYLPPPPRALVQAWEDRLGPRHELRVGLVWSGYAAHKNDRNRSIPLSTLVPLLALDASFISLQKDPRPDDKAVLLAHRGIVDLTEHLTDFTETAALLAGLDLVITVDTSVAHLAGTLGIPTWILLPYTPDFRWLLSRDDSPWYPSMRLFRQGEDRNYASVIARVRTALTSLISAAKTG
jgi:tetratricopeptide (TPR) repeat protein